MTSKRFENKAQRAWWGVHIEAWLKSGLTCTTYCRHQALNRRSFNRWLNVLLGEEVLKTKEKLRERRRLRHQRARRTLSSDRRNRAAQAFCAMHVGALN